MTFCFGPSMLVGKPCLSGPEGPHRDLDGVHEYQPGVLVLESAVLWRDCEECGSFGYGGNGGHEMNSEAEMAGTEEHVCRVCPVPCRECGGSGRVRVGVCWIEPGEWDGLRNEIMEELHWGLDGIICPDLMEMTDRILALLGVKEEK